MRAHVMTKTPQRVLVFCLSGLGDAVMASPALAALASEPQRFRLTLLTMFPSVTDYLREQGFTDDVRFVDFIRGPKRESYATLWRLRQEHFDVSVLPYPHNRLEYNGVARVIGAKLRIGFRYQKQRTRNLPGLNHVVLDEDPTLHVVQENLRWAAQLTNRALADIADDMLFRTTAATETGADRFAQEKALAQAAPLIGMHPSCNPLKNQQNRCWPPQAFVQLVENLSRQLPGARFLLFEGPQDAQLAQMIRDGARSVVAARMLPIGVVASLIRRCQLFISNCSGLIHVAAACNVPTVGIYGPTNPAWDGPWKTPSIVVHRDLPCRPCFYYSSRPLDCPAGLDYACVRDLPVAQVQAAALQLLKQNHRPLQPV